MEVQITPKDRKTFSVNTIGEPQYSEAVPGGYKDATFGAVLNTSQAEWLLDAKVRLIGPGGPVWAGDVWGYDGGKVTCVGPAARLLILMRAAGAPTYSAQTSTAVITDALSKLSTYDLPAAYRSLYVGTESTSLTFALDVISYEGDVVAEALKYVDWQFGFWMRQVDNSGTLFPVPVYEARPSAAEYIVQVDRPLNGRSMDSLASVIRVKKADGTFTDVTDSDTTHYLPQIGRVKYSGISVNTNTAGLATAAGTVALLDKGRSQVSGPLPVAGNQVQLTNGLPVRPCDIEAGKLIRVVGNDGGARTGRLVHVDKVGTGAATLWIDESPAIPKALRGILNL